MKTCNNEQKMRLSQPEQMAQGLRATFATLAAFGEVVLHELLEPSRALLATHLRVSGRQMGDLRIELGRARMVGP